MRGHGSVERYVHDMVGHNFRMEEIQAGVLHVKLRYLEGWTKRRRKIAQLYRSLLKGIEGIVLPAEKYGVKHVYHLFVIRVLDGRRDALGEYLENKGIVTGLHYPIPIHLQKAYSSLGHKRGDFPVAEQQAAQVLSLPIYPEMEEEKVEYVSENIRSFFNV